MRRLPITPVLEQLRGEAIEHNSEQDRDSVRPDVMIEVAEPSRPSASTPRLVSESQAAADICLESHPSAPGSPTAGCRAHCLIWQV